MNKTLLDLVQEILSSIDGSEVNSYLDTTESIQIAKILENTYWDIVSTSSFPKLFSFYNLTPGNTTSQPTLMYLPDTSLTLTNLRYNHETLENPGAAYSLLTFVPMDEFFNRMYSLDPSASTTTTYTLSLPNGGTTKIHADNVSTPTSYTSYDDKTIIFNSFDKRVDAFLQASKTMAYGEISPVWTVSDSFTPYLPEKQFTILRNEAKATAFAELKQTTNSDASRKARRGWISSQKGQRKINNPRNNLDTTPNYGKKR
jgi:hypothetical protein